VMLVPVALLALGSVVTGFLLQFPLPGIGKNFIGDWLNPVFAQYGGTVISEPSTAVALLTQAIGLAASLAGVGLARQWFYFRKPDAQVVASRIPRFLTLLSLHRFYFDDIYDAVLVRPSLAVANRVRRVVEPRYIDGAVQGVGKVLSEVSLDFRVYQTGFIRDYAAIMTVGAVGFVAIMVLLVAR
jgi:NADH-quinone oxidoreductase subunit L